MALYVVFFSPSTLCRNEEVASVAARLSSLASMFSGIFPQQRHVPLGIDFSRCVGTIRHFFCQT
jgi:hypothetical protein